ncbi:MAG: hypothetical protein R6V46_15735 [Desulfatiglandaceae bacterium]
MKRSMRGRQIGFMCLLLGLAGVMTFLTALGDVWARPHRLGRIPDAKLGCGVCHVNPAGGGARNSFGEDYKLIGIASGDKYTEKLGAKDSDGDDYSNDQEFAAGTHPGDSKSKPSN